MVAYSQWVAWEGSLVEDSPVADIPSNSSDCSTPYRHSPSMSHTMLHDALLIYLLTAAIIH